MRIETFEESGNAALAGARHACGDRRWRLCGHQGPAEFRRYRLDDHLLGAGADDDHPGLGLFYGGMVRKKNVLATLAQSFGATCIITVLWMIIGYSIAFTAQSQCRHQRTSSAASTICS